MRWIKWVAATMARGWPARLEQQWGNSRIVLRPLRVRADRAEFLQLREENAAWTRPWDSTSPGGPRIVTYGELVREHNLDARRGHMLPFAMEVDGRLAGQMHLFGITRGALLSGSGGYWIGERFAGRGFATCGLAMLIDHAFGPCRLHRVEVNIRPDNPRSLRVVDKLGLRDEGLRQRYLHIDGEWQDHRSFAITVDELAGQSLLERLRTAVP